MKKELASTWAVTHGKSRNSTEYDIWTGIITRCENPNHHSYEHYGLRGITVSDEFRNDFPTFLAHVGPRPSPRHSLDRIENDKGCERDNLRWVTAVEQARNRRSTILVEAFGRRQLQIDWAREFGISQVTLSYRIRVGWPVEKALTKPVRSTGRVPK